MQLLIGDYPAATASQTQALQLYRDLGDRQGQAWALNNLGAVQQCTGDYPAATASQAQALRLFRDLGDRRGQAWALNQLGLVERLTGDYVAATASLTQALQLFRDLSDRHGQADASINLGELLSLSSAHPSARSTTPTRSASPATSTLHSRKHGHSKESDDATSRKETPAKALRTYDKPSQSTGASEPRTLSTSRRPSSTSDDHRGRHAHLDERSVR